MYASYLKQMSCLIVLSLVLTGCFPVRPLEEIALKEIEVEIKGDVKKPGTYVLPKGSNIGRLLELAVVEDTADLSGFNLHQIIHNHDVIVIQPKGIIEKISINTASLEELQKLPGVGPATANAIIQYRETNGLFQSLTALMQVKGIASKKFEKMREFVKL